MGGGFKKYVFATGKNCKPENFTSMKPSFAKCVQTTGKNCKTSPMKSLQHYHSHDKKTANLTN